MRQIARPRGNFIEKIIRDGNGRLVRATFCVYENGGHIKARLLNVVYLKESPSLSAKIFTLGGQSQENIFPQEIVSKIKVTSPYFNSYLLYFSGSKPRAPTI